MIFKDVLLDLPEFNEAKKLRMLIDTVTVFFTVMAELKIFEGSNPVETIEQLGEKALQAKAAGIIPEKFETFESYRKAVENIKIDPSQTNDFSRFNKIWEGMHIFIKTIEAKTNIGMERFIMETGHHTSLFTSDRVKTYIETFMKNKIDLNKATDYFGKKLNDRETITVQETIFEAEKKLSPASSLKDIESLIEKISSEHKK